jgi:hypothetical protein
MDKSFWNLVDPDITSLVLALQESLDIWRKTNTTEEDLAKRRVIVVANRYQHGKEPRNCEVRILSTTHFQVDHVTHSFSNLSASRETGLEMPCCPDNDLLWVQITQSYPNRLRFSSLPCPQSPCHAVLD